MTSTLPTTPPLRSLRPGTPLRRTMVLLAALVLAALTATSTAAAAPSSQETLHVQGMVCPNCEATVESLLTGMDGITHATADHSSRTVTVTFDPARVNPQQMVQQINSQTYYRASLAPPPTTSPSGGNGEQDWVPLVLVIATLALGLLAIVIPFSRRAGTARAAAASNRVKEAGDDVG